MPFDGNGLDIATQQKTSWWSRFLLSTGIRKNSARGKVGRFETRPDLTPVMLLTCARGLIQDESHWVQRQYERVNDGRVRWCAIGALREALWKLDGQPEQFRTARLLLEMAAQEHGHFNTVETFNDQKTHKEVLQLFDDAILKARRFC